MARWLHAVTLLSALACRGTSEPGPTLAPAQSLHFGGPGFQSASAITATAGSVVVAGLYAEGLEYGPLTLAGGGGLDGFVMGLAPDGDVRFAHRLAGAGDDGVADVVADADGGVILGGHVTESAELDGVVLDVRPSGAALIAKLDADGRLVWSSTAGGSGLQSMTAVAVSSDGAVYGVGDFTGEIDFGSGSFVATGGGDAFLARFSASGELEWLRAIGGAGIQVAHRLVLGADGSVLVGGAFSEQLSIDGLGGDANHELNQTPFIAGFDASGRVSWVQSQVIPHARSGNAAETGDDHASTMHTNVERLALASTPSGGLIALVAHGEFFSLHGQDFEAPAVSTVAVSQMDEVGGVVARATFDNPASLIQIGNVVPFEDGMHVVGSWTGALEIDGRTFVTAERRRLLLSRVADDGALLEARHFGLEGRGLTGHDAVTVGSSIWVAARSMDPTNNDYDVFVGRFEP